MKKQFLGVFLVGISLSLFSGCVSKTEAPITMPEAKEEVVVPERDNFTVEFLKFNEPYKKALLSTGKADAFPAKVATVATAKMWEDIETMFLKAQPEEYRATEDWSKKLTDIGKLINDSQVLEEEGDWAGAHEKLEEVRKDLRVIREENNITLLTDKMLVFHDLMEEYLSNGDAKDLNALNAMHAAFSPVLNWKEYRGDKEYNAAALSVGSIVDRMMEAEGEEYTQLLKSLKPAFVKFYIQYG